MAGKAPSRLKRERAHLVKPYERPKTFLNRVISTVKDLITPSWLSSDITNDFPEDDEIETNTVDNANDELPSAYRITTDIPFKRPQAPKSLNVNNFSCDTLAPPDDCSPSASSEKPTEHQRANLGDFPSTSKSTEPQVLVNGDDHSENSEASCSTSGCSSIIPSHQVKAPKPHLPGFGLAETPMIEKSRVRKNLGSAGDLSLIDDNSPKMPTLWSEKLHQPQPLATNKQPSFTLSAFGAPNLSANKSPGSNKLESPFYKGKTTYGGASAYRRFNLFSSPYTTKRVCTKAKIQKSQGAEDQVGCLSNTARQILQTLEKMSTPLEDAKKMSIDKVPESPFQNFVPPRFGLSNRARPNISRGPPTNTSPKPVPVKVMKNIQPLVSQASIEKQGSSLIGESIMGSDTGESAMKRRKAVEPFMTDLTKECEEPPPKFQPPAFLPMSEEVPGIERGGSGGGKMKSQLRQSLHLSSKSNRDDEVVEVPSLPNVSLPITTLPTFNFLSKKPSDSPQSLPVPTTLLSQGSTPPMKPFSNFSTASPSPVPKAVVTSVSSGGNGLKFTFSTPVKYSAPSGPSSSASGQEFSFSSPVLVTSLLSSGKQDTAKNGLSSTIDVQFKAQSIPVKKDENTFGGIKPATDLIKSGSVMDVLGKLDSEIVKPAVSTLEKPFGSGNNPGGSSSGFGNKFKPTSGSWECSSCLVRNKESDTSCIACTASKPGSKDLAMKFEGFGDKFRPAPGSWKCSSCDVMNKEIDVNCVCCSCSKPGSTNMKTSGLGAAETLKAPTCSRLGSVSKLETSLSGSLSSTKERELPKAGFGDLSRPSANSWDCKICMVRNKAESDRCSSCETPRVTPVKETAGFGDKFKAAEGTWECSSCMVRNKKADSTCVACTASRPGSSTAASSGGFGDKFKPAEGSWECSSCMVRNKESDVTCVACAASKPGSAAIKMSASGGFKFGMPTTTSAASSDTTSTSDKATGTSLAGFAGAFSKPGSAAPLKTSSTGFVFGAAPIPSDAPPSGIKFGIPVVTSTLTTPSLPTGFRFSAPTTQPASSVTSGFVFGSSTTLTAGNGMTPAEPAPTKFAFSSSESSLAVSSPFLSTTATTLSTMTTTITTTTTSASTSLSSAFGGAAPNFNFGSSDPPKSSFGASDVKLTTVGTTGGFSNPTPTDSTGGFKIPSLSSSSPFGLSSATTTTSLSSASLKPTQPQTSMFKFGDSQGAAPASSAPKSDLFKFENTGSISSGTAVPSFKMGSAAAGDSSVKASINTDSKSISSTFGTPAGQPVNTFSFTSKDDKKDNKADNHNFSFMVKTTESSSDKSKVSFSLGNSNAGSTGQMNSMFTFGSKAPSEEKPSGFNFQPTNASEVSSSVGPKFVFGQKTESAPPPAANFTFGGQAPGTTTATTAGQSNAFGIGDSSPFAFKPNAVPSGLSTSTTVFGSKPAVTSAAPFSFGAPTPTTPSSSTPVSGPALAPTPSLPLAFGSNAGSVSSTPFGVKTGDVAPAQSSSFGFLSPPAPAATPVFGQQQPVAPAQESASNQVFNATPTFQFGNPAPSSTVFRFGQQEPPSQEGNSGVQASGNGGFPFTFGPNPSLGNTGGGNSMNFNPNPTFNFSATSTPATPPQFLMPGTGSDNPFSATASSQQRKIRRAVRRKPPRGRE